jgi:SPP1 gp7 family putative phage head morphogenesis protein
MRPPEGPALAYRKHLRSLSADVAARVRLELEPLIDGTVEPDRQDAAWDVRETVRARLANIRRNMLGTGKQQSKAVDTIAGRVVEANGREFERVLRINPRQVSANLSLEIDKFRRENVDLIQSIPDTLLDDVGKVLDESWSKGERVEVLRAKIEKRFEVSKSKADLIARDQVLKLNAQVTRERQKASGITEYIWITSRDERVRGNPDGLYPDSSHDHYSLDGTRQRWDAPPQVADDGTTAHPGEDYQCRCIAAPVLSFLEDDADE